MFCWPQSNITPLFQIVNQRTILKTMLPPDNKRHPKKWLSTEYVHVGIPFVGVIRRGMKLVAPIFVKKMI